MRISAPPKRRRSGKRVTEGQAQDWLARVRAGATPREISDQDNVQARTVQEHLSRLAAFEERVAMRRDLLRAAMNAHQEDLLGTAKTLLAQLTSQDERLGDPGPLTAGAKRLEALRKHTMGSGLSPLLDQWKVIARGWFDVIQNLDKQLSRGVEERGLSVDGAVPALREDAVLPYARSGQKGRLGLGWASHNPGPGIWWGAYRVIDGAGLSDSEIATRKRQFEALHAQLSEWPVATELRRLHDRAVATRCTLSDRLEDIVMRRYFDGECRWCPGSSGQRRRTHRPSPSRS